MVDITSILTSVLSGGQSNSGGGQLGDLLNKAIAGGGGQAQSGGGLNDILGKLTGGAGQQQGGGGIGDLLGSILGGAQQGGQQQGGGLGDLLGSVLGGAQQGGQQQGGGLGDLLGSVLGGGAQQGGQQQGGGLGDLLGSVLGGGAQQGGQQQGGGLGDLLGSVLGGAQQSGQQQGGGLGDLLGSVLGGGAQQGGQTSGGSDILSTLIKSGALAGLAGAVFGGGGRAMAGKAAKIGGLAILANIAMKALANYRAGGKKPGNITALLNIPSDTAYTSEFDDNTMATLLLRAMVGAAASDGEISAEERHAIVGQLSAIGITSEQQAFIDGVMENPVDMASLARQVDSEETKAQLYLASAMVIEVDTEEEEDYLANLATELGFNAKLKSHLDHAALAARAQA